MPIKSYYGLVWEHIPGIIEADGKVCTAEILSNEGYLHLLDTKLNTDAGGNY